MKTISLATSAWTNSSRSCPPIPLILRPCAPLFSILGPLNVLKLRLLRSHVNPLHVVPLPLQLPLTPCHHMLPNHLLHSLTRCPGVKQVANFPLPSLLSNQSDTLTKARAAAAEGYLSPFTIPLLAEPETLVQPARLNWVLRFPLPPPNPLSNRRFSSTPSYHYGPRTPQALDAAIRYAANFSYDDPTPTHPQAAAFVQLPDPIIKFGDVRRPTTEPPSPPPPDFQTWLQSGAIRLHSQNEYQLFGAHIPHLPALLESHFFGHISLDQLIPLLSLSTSSD